MMEEASGATFFDQGLRTMDHPRISQNPKVMMGKPVIRGTRVTVEILLRLLGGGLTVEEVVDCYPGISAEDVHAAQAFAADSLSEPQGLGGRVTCGF